jgi:hypothetical protein
MMGYCARRDDSLNERAKLDLHLVLNSAADCEVVVRTLEHALDDLVKNGLIRSDWFLRTLRYSR